MTTVARAEASREAGEAKLRAVHERLTTAIAELTSAENWQLMLRTAAKLPTYSPHNVLLITSQCPQASAVAGFHTWKQLGRSVRKGEKGLAILAPVLRKPLDREGATAAPSAAGADGGGVPQPSNEAGSGADAGSTEGGRRVTGFRVVHVFDISQTDGPDLPEVPRPVLLEGQAPAGLLEGLTTQVTEQGFQLLRHDFDMPHPGVGVPNGVTDYFARTVIVRPDLSDAQASKTLAHELGHVLLHEPTRRPADLTRQQAEVEAESIAHIVADAHGLDTRTYTIPYVAGWSEGNLELLARSAERVIATSQQILRHTPPPPTTVLTEHSRSSNRSLDTRGQSERQGYRTGTGRDSDRYAGRAATRDVRLEVQLEVPREQGRTQVRRDEDRRRDGGQGRLW
jgi:hypothetical protein